MNSQAQDMKSGHFARINLSGEGGVWLMRDKTHEGNEKGGGEFLGRGIEVTKE